MAISFRPLKAEEVDVRVGQCKENGVSLLLFKDARVDMALLDEVVGPESWECLYEEIGGKLFCTVRICCKGDSDKYNWWVEKQDVGVPSNMESTKGEASDAFKRACFKWGIGRELYTAPFIWVPSEKCNIKKNSKSGKLQCFDDFRVTEMEVEDGRIVKLQVCNMSRRGIVVYGSQSEEKEPDVPENDVLKVAWERVKKAVWDWCKRHECATEQEFKAKLDGIRKRPEWESQSGSLDYLNSLVREFEDG